jgi:hypothetical protein
MNPVVPYPVELLDLVNIDEERPPASQEDNQTSADQTVADWNNSEFFGDQITKKQNNTLRIGYQNIGG